MNLPAFDSLVNKPFEGLLMNTRRIILLWGGRGSGKSIAAIRLLIFRCLLEPYFKCILIRKVYDTVKESMFEAIKDEVHTLGLERFFEFRLQPMEIRCINGNKFICRGLDKPEKLRSIKEPSCAWYEEGNQIEESDFINVSTSIRANKARFLQEIFSFNPEPDVPKHTDFWIYKKFFEGHTEKTFDDYIEIEDPRTRESIKLTYSSIWSTYHDNPHLPPEFIAMLEVLKKDNPYYYKVFALGLWGSKDTGNLFYKTFSLDNVKRTEYIPSLPIHLSFDENVHPYLTCTVHQLRSDGNKVKIWQIDEITLEHPKNTLKDTCAEFTRRYRSHTEGVFIYGDRTSKKQDAKLEKGQDFFTLIYDYLKDFRPQMRIPSQNPNVRSRGEFICDMFAGRDPEVEIIIGENCVHTVDDYLNVVEAADGTKNKAKIKDKNTGVSFEKYGHCFVAGTMVRTENGSKPIEEIKVGDLVHTRSGLKPVIFSGMTRKNAKVKTYEIDGKRITCTPDHEVFTKNKGFKAVESLTGKNIFCIFNEWKEKQRNSTGENFTVTQTRKILQIEGTTKAGRLKGRKLIYTVTYMKLILGLFLKAIIYITKTATSTTTTFQTLKCLVLKIIISIIGAKKAKKKRSLQLKRCGKKLRQRQKNGIKAKRAGNGTQNTLKTFMRKIKRLLSVKSAAHLKKAEVQLFDFVPANVKTDTTPGSIEDVYDITVQGKHEFFANDILVHNCSDANDYLYIEVLKSKYNSYISGNKTIDYKLIPRTMVVNKNRM